MRCLQLFFTLWVFLLSFVLSQEAPIWVQGSLEDATATDDTFNTGGSIVVNGFTMNVPKNLLVQFPAAWVPWKEFVNNKADLAGFETLVSLGSISICALVVSLSHPSIISNTKILACRSLGTASTESPVSPRFSCTSSSKASAAASWNRLTSRTAV